MALGSRKVITILLAPVAGAVNSGRRGYGLNSLSCTAGDNRLGGGEVQLERATAESIVNCIKVQHG